MPRKLLCELHAHTTWSDGDLTVRELVDAYGTAGFDVLAVTDHVVRPDDSYLAEGVNRSVEAADFAAYAAELEREAERASELYGLLLIRIRWKRQRGRPAAPHASRSSRSGQPVPSIASSSATATTSFRGSPMRACRRLRPATSTGSSTSRRGRR